MQWYQKQVDKLKTWHMPSLNEYIALIVVVGIAIVWISFICMSIGFTTITGQMVQMAKNISGWIC